MNRVVTSRAALKGAVLVGVVFLAGCAVTGPGGDHRTVVIHPGGDTSLDAVSIPAGHLPPPGECRIWYPDRSPGDQPPPGNCRDLQYHVPPGAVLVRG
ncbi:hypothetical protein D5687_06725 [Guyparkeria sp. SCN-R1]|uniref:hypothetical protein n=1 Tax=Guyparkeria sp. SCN-R1 TaxID=2341113 RepID=UPI000F647D8B|nr:hypothetical protein [Guyparkeria sp. SCN-R1]RRQ23440.1 hypothetical protein D5687_06725 [Guyparkeria sp. SCN-R1]